MSEQPLFGFSAPERLEYERTLLRALVSAQLENWIEHSGIQAKELARRMHKSKSWVSKLLGGGQNATLDTIAEAAAALGARWEPCLVPAERVGTPAEHDPKPPAWANSGSFAASPITPGIRWVDSYQPDGRLQIKNRQHYYSTSMEVFIIRADQREAYKTLNANFANGSRLGAKGNYSHTVNDMVIGVKV